MKPEFSKPFDLAAARAGAPYCCRNGDTAKVYEWARDKGSYPLWGVVNQLFQVGTWTATGAYTPGRESPLDLVMIPLGMVEGKPVFTGDVLDFEGKPHTILATGRTFPRCTWPAPAKVYPETRMTGAELFDIVQSTAPAFRMTVMGVPSIEPHMVAAANAALRHAIDAGQVVPTAEANQNALEHYHSGLGVRAARDMAIAEAVRDAAYVKVMNCPDSHEGTIVRQIDLITIISKI
jgi:hypothetical protein